MALIFFDIDGTLWDGHMQIPESTIPTLKKLQANGHKIFLCSGRSRASIQAKELMDVGFDGILAACGNHIELNNEIVHENILSPELTEKVIDILRECRMPVVLEGPDYMWIDEKGFEDDPYVVYLFQELGKSAQTLKGYTSDIRINKFSADILYDTDYEKIKEQLQDEFEFVEHVEKVVEFVPKGTSKATGIAWLCDYLGVDSETVSMIWTCLPLWDMELRWAMHRSRQKMQLSMLRRIFMRMESCMPWNIMD